MRVPLAPASSRFGAGEPLKGAPRAGQVMEVNMEIKKVTLRQEVKSCVRIVD